MLTYILKLIILLPLIAGLAYASLWLWKRQQMGVLNFAGQTPDLPARIVQVLPMGVQGKMMVVEFGEQQLLIGVNRQQFQLLGSRKPDAND